MRFSGFLKETPVCKKKNAPQKYPKIPGQRTEVSAKPGSTNTFFFFFLKRREVWSVVIGGDPFESGGKK